MTFAEGTWSSWLVSHHDDLLDTGLPSNLIENERSWAYLLGHAGYPQNDSTPAFSTGQLSSDSAFVLLRLLCDTDVPESPVGQLFVTGLRHLVRKSPEWPRRVLADERLSVYCDGAQIGETKNLGFDDGMGIASGEFFPSEEYYRVESIFLAHAAASLVDSKTADLERERDSRGFELCTCDGCLMPVEWLHIYDFRKTHGIGEMQIEAPFGADRQAKWRSARQGSLSL